MNINYYNPYVRAELYHHGILGQKWGKRNGPPYPLGASDHSASEKKAGWRKSLDNGSARGATKELNRLDQKRATARYDEYVARSKAQKLSNKAAKADRKGNWEKAERLKAKAADKNSKADAFKRNREAIEKQTSSILKELTSRGYDVHSKEVDRLVHPGRAIAESTLKTAGIMTISMVSGAPITGAVFTRRTVSGKKYKAYKNRYSKKGSITEHEKRESRLVAIANPPSVHDSVQRAMAEVRAERKKNGR